MRSRSAEGRPVVLSILLALLGLSVAVALAAGDEDIARVRANYGNLEMSFEANWGQADPAARFLARGSGYGIMLTPTEAVLSLKRAAPLDRDGERRTLQRGERREVESTLMRLRLLGSGGAVQMYGEGLLPGKINYFSGPDPANWRTDIPTYRRVRLEGVYPGIDLV